MVEERRLAGILSADVAGYSRLMSTDETNTIRMLKIAQQHFAEFAQRNAGRVVDAVGDNLLAEFRSVVDAVACGVAFQAALGRQDEGLAADRRVCFRIGVHIGDVIVDDDRIFGDGVNVAARVQSIAPPGGVCVSGTALELILGKLPVEFDDLGVRELKNIARPVHVYQVKVREGEIEHFLERGGRAGVRSVGTHRATSRPTSPQNLLLAMWDLLDPILQDAFALAYNKKLRNGSTRISTRDLFQALVRIQDGSLHDLLLTLPAGSMPDPIAADVPGDPVLLSEDPQLSDCIADSLRGFRDSPELPRRLNPTDVFVDISENGHGPSVERLRKQGIDRQQIEQRVKSLGVRVLRRSTSDQAM